MTFTADSTVLRTFDNDRGYELFSGRNGPDGIQQWKIVRSGGQAIFFSTIWEPEFNAEWRRRNPTVYNPVIRLVRSLRRMFSDLSHKESDALIIEALHAFQGFHGIPGDAHVAVFFESLGSNFAQDWWKPLLED